VVHWRLGLAHVLEMLAPCRHAAWDGAGATAVNNRATIATPNTSSFRRTRMAFPQSDGLVFLLVTCLLYHLLQSGFERQGTSCTLSQG